MYLPKLVILHISNYMVILTFYYNVFARDVFRSFIFLAYGNSYNKTPLVINRLLLTLIFFLFYYIICNNMYIILLKTYFFFIIIIDFVL